MSKYKIKRIEPEFLEHLNMYDLQGIRFGAEIQLTDVHNHDYFVQVDHGKRYNLRIEYEEHWDNIGFDSIEEALTHFNQLHLETILPYLEEIKE